MRAEAQPRVWHQHVVELRKGILHAEDEAAGERAVGDALDVRRNAELDVLCEVAGDVDVSAREVECIEAVAVLELGVILHVGERPDVERWIRRFGGGRRRGCRWLGERPAGGNQREEHNESGDATHTSARERHGPTIVRACFRTVSGTLHVCKRLDG